MSCFCSPRNLMMFLVLFAVSLVVSSVLWLVYHFFFGTGGLLVFVIGVALIASIGGQ